MQHKRFNSGIALDYCKLDKLSFGTFLFHGVGDPKIIQKTRYKVKIASAGNKLLKQLIILTKVNRFIIDIPSA